MIMAQFDVDEKQVSVLLVVIENDNLKRMEQADPVTLEQKTDGGYLRPIKYPNGFRVLIAYEPESGPIYQMVQQGKSEELLKYLMRGYSFKSMDGKKAVPLRGQQT